MTRLLQAWLDASAGVAGDMVLGALVDAGADLGAVQSAVEAVIPGAVRLTGTVVSRAGLRATKVDVAVLVDDPPHRTWRTIRELLAAAHLAEPVRTSAMTVFGRLAAAEAHVHGIDLDDVHFHEVGALDSIADVVGVCAALHRLGVVRVTAGEVAVGSGRVRTAHGDIPVPVPAVAEMSRGWRIRAAGPGELATPTGMAVITGLAAACTDLPAMSVRSVGVGAGTRDTPGTPNVVRVILGEIDPLQPAENGEELVVLEANVDDLDPRLWPGVLAQFLADGAADAWLTPILMKKGRPAHTLSVLARAEQTAAVRRLMFRLTSTIGIRENVVQRFALARVFAVVHVAGSPVAIKIAHRDGTIIRATPEFSDVAAAAEGASLPPGTVMQEAIAAAWNAGLRPGAPIPKD
ncbi:nickel pincer cofactor biosynthesis protein LarC [Nakamurella sp. GG22]